MYRFLLGLAAGVAFLWITLGLSTGVSSATGDEAWDDRFGLSSVEYGSVRALAVDGADLYIGGTFASAGLLPANNIAHWDGRRWWALDMGVNGTVNALAVFRGRLYAGGDFTQAGTVAVNGIAVWDGTQWAALDGGGAGVMQDGYAGGVVRALAATDNGLYIGGDFTHINGLAALDIARWDGSQLTPLGGGVGELDYSNTLVHDGGIFALVAALDGSIYAGGNFTHAGNQQPLLVNSLARWDPAQRQWQAVGGGITKSYGKGEVRSLAVDNNGDLYVGGQFVKAGNVSVNSIASWDGQRWNTLGGGLGFDSAYSYVNSLALVDGALYAGGGMISMGSQRVNGLAVWQENRWAAVGGGIRDSYEGALSLAASGDGGVYVAGAFTGAGGLFSRNLIKWTGSAWEALGQGVGYGSISGWLKALAADQDGLVYAGGYFDRIAGQPTNNIAVWDGLRWSGLGQGVNGAVYALATHGSTVYVGGAFTQADGVNADSIAHYNRVTGRWSALGSGLNGYVYALAVADDGTLFVGGDFIVAGNVQHLARWDGVRWSGLGDGISPNGAVRALAWDGRVLYIGGGFRSVQEGSQQVAVNGLLAWDSQTGNRYLLGDGENAGVARRTSSGDFAGEVYALAVTDRALYVGGVFDKAGNVAASGVAAYDFQRGWQALGNGVNSMYTPHVYALAVLGDRVYVGGDFGAAGVTKTTAIARWDESMNRWQVLGEGLSAEAVVNALTVFGGSVYVGGHFVSAGGVPAAGFSRWGPPAQDSAERIAGEYAARRALWGRSDFPGIVDFAPAVTPPVKLIPISINNRVEALAADGDGRLYAGGSFDRIAEQPTRNIALWDGVGWSGLGEGVNGPVYALATHDSKLYVGGAFTRAGSAVTSNIAQYDSATRRWRALGGGVNGAVYALAVAEDGTLFAAGDFTTAGGADTQFVARWDGVRWSKLGGGINLNSGVRALAWDGRVLYIGGGFSSVEDGGQRVTVNGLLAWDSQTDNRFPLGNGANIGVTRRGNVGGTAGTVYVLAMTDRTLYVGGVFDRAGRVAASSVAAYDLQQGWRALGSGVGSMYSSSVYALAVVDNNLYVGGDFRGIGMTMTTGLARWDGARNHWQALVDGLGTNASVKAVAYFGGSFYAGGHFVSADRTSTIGFSRWGLAVGNSADLPGQEYMERSTSGMPIVTNQIPVGTPVVTPFPLPTRSVPLLTTAPTATPVTVPTRVNLTPTVTPTATPIITPAVTGTRTPTATPCPFATVTSGDAGSEAAPCGR